MKNQFNALKAELHAENAKFVNFINDCVNLWPDVEVADIKKAAKESKKIRQEFEKKIKQVSQHYSVNHKWEESLIKQKLGIVIDL